MSKESLSFFVVAIKYKNSEVAKKLAKIFNMDLDEIQKRRSFIADKSISEQKWRSEILSITIRVNGKSFKEAYNRVFTLDLNLILYLIKFLKIEPELASRKVETG